MGLMLEQAARTSLMSGCKTMRSLSKQTQWMKARTSVSQICIPPCRSPRLQSTRSLLYLLSKVLEPSGVLLHFHILCTSTGCPLQTGTNNTRVKLHLKESCWGYRCSLMSLGPATPSPAHRFLCRGRRETLQLSPSRPCQCASWGEPVCFWLWCRSLAWSLHLSVEEVPEEAAIINSSEDCSVLQTD